MALLSLSSLRNTNFDFIGFRKIAFIITAIVVFGSIFLFFFRGLNYGIDFKGGIIIEARSPQTVELSKLRIELEKLNLGEFSLQDFGDAHDILIRIERQEGGEEAQNVTIDKIKNILNSDVEYRRIETIGPKVSAELISNALQAIVYALIGMLIYVAFRFEWNFGLCAIFALIHDCIAIIGVYSLLQLDFTETAIISILITAGYSINDTIVIFDRIRENMKKYKKKPLIEIINLSINQTLSRTILTVGTTLLALLTLYLFGGPVIATFSFPILIGVAFGSFSSICVAAPLLLYLNVNKNKIVDEKQNPAAF